MNRRTTARLNRKRRIRKKIRGTGERPRLSVFRSARHIYAQIVDDKQGRTLVSEKLAGLKKSDTAKEVGRLLAARAKQEGISQVIFDRNGFLYHGRVKAVAESCREHGLVF